MSGASNVFEGFDRYNETQQKVNNKHDVPKEDVRRTSKSNASSLDTSAPYYEFTPKHQWSTKNNPLCGICFPEWFQILRTRWHVIEWTTFWPRLLMISLMSIINSILNIPERLFYGKHIDDTDLNTILPPLFILGHPRTGTTLLHSLLALDGERFGICTTFCAGFPSCFLWFESIGKLLFSGVMDETRPMDNVKLHFDLPQEDELATNVLSGGVSPYMPLFFMKQEKEFRPYYAFADDGRNNHDRSRSSDLDDEWLPPDEMANARKTWTTSFLHLCKKLTVRSRKKQGPGRRLLFKSPVHTARIPLLLQLFPNAQFIYIHRHPYDVFRSAAHMADTTYCYTYMNMPSNDNILEFILRQYEILWDRYEEGRTMLLSNTSYSSQQRQLVEVSFDELESSPLPTIENVYQALGWNMTNQYRERLHAELSSVKLYKRNAYTKDLPQDLKAILQQRWGPSFQRLKYKM